MFQMKSLCMAYGRPLENKIQYEVLLTLKSRDTPDLLDWLTWNCLRALYSITTKGWKILSLETRVDGS